MLVASVGLCLSAVGCGGGTGAGPGGPRRGSSEIGGSVVSTVNGHPIYVAEVEEVARATGLSPEEALRRLQTEQLLMAEAERRGVAGPAIEQVADRARVQALLEAEAAANEASESELREAYEKDPRFHVPERRASTHVLAKLDAKASPEQEQAARAIAERAIADLEKLDLPELQQRYAGEIDGIKVKVESLPAVDREDNLVKEYMEALYSLSSPGVVPEPVRTRFGWHAIHLTQILPPHETPFEVAVKTLRPEVSNRKKAAAVTSLLTDLRRTYAVTVMDGVNDKLSVVDGTESLRGR